MITFPSHVAGGYLGYRLSTDVLKVFPQSDLLLATAILGAVIPDIDALFYHDLRDHHDSWLHYPVFWIILIGSLLLVNQVGRIIIPEYILSFIIGLTSHFLLDWLSARMAGMKLFFPLSRKSYSLFPLDKTEIKHISCWDFLQPKSEYNRMYVKNKVLLYFEVILNMLAVIFFLYKLILYSLILNH